MLRYVLFLLLLMAGLCQPIVATDALPPRPTPPAASPGAAGLGATAPASDAKVNDFFGSREAAGPDYFSSDTAYDGSSSDDTGGGGFDDSSDNSGSW